MRFTASFSLIAVLATASAFAQGVTLQLDLRFKFSPDNPDYSTLRREPIPQGQNPELPYEDGETKTGKRLRDFQDGYMVGHVRETDTVTGKDLCDAIEEAKRRYGEPQRSLPQSLRSMARKIEELEATSALAQKVQAATGGSRTGLGASDAAARVLKTAPSRAPAPIPRGSTPQRGSDITGTENVKP